MPEEIKKLMHNHITNKVLKGHKVIIFLAFKYTMILGK